MKYPTENTVEEQFRKENPELSKVNKNDKKKIVAKK